MAKTAKLTIDVGPLFEDQWTGIPVFTRRLIQALIRHGGVDLEFCHDLVRIPKERVLAAIKVGTGTYLRGEYQRGVAEGFGLVQTGESIFYPSVKENFDIVLREASTVHDLSTLFMPETHDEANIDFHMKNLARQLASDDVVFCTSEATQAALTTAFPSVSAKTRILHQFADWPEEFAAMDRNLPPLAFGRYAVVIGTIEPRKNLQLLVRALSTPEVRDSALAFVVIGKKGWKVDEILETISPEARNRLRFSGFVTEFTKYRLLRHCEFLVFPSIYEGFGIPALEAMSLGKPILAALTSSFPEVVGDAGIYFDPFSLSEFSAAFGEMYKISRLAELGPRAVAGASAFGWERMAKPVVEWLEAI